MMEIIVGKTAGFCFGVERAVEGAKKALKENEEVCCLGELAHNNYVLEQLYKIGLIQIEDINDAPENSKVIIRPHGEAPKTYETAKKRKLELIDLTCPRVEKVHDIAEKYKSKGFAIIITGEEQHPEVIGTKGWAGDNSYIVQNAEQLRNIDTSGKTCLISQTTFSVNEFEKITEYLNQTNKNIEIINTICETTKERQKEVKEIAKNVDLMIIIGGKKSDNTTKLVKIAETVCENVIRLEDANIDVEYVSKFKKVGIMAGASTPKDLIEKIIDMINNKG